jgi:long-subunit fatty acid transport protein
MKNKLPSAAVISAVLALSYASVVHANPEFPVQFDARSLGMGGGGVAYIDSGAAVFHNPASLDRVEKLAITAAVTPFIVSSHGPLPSPAAGTDPQPTRDGKTQVVPLFLAGFGVRVHDRVVIGAGVHVRAGIGTLIEDAPELPPGVPLDFQLAVMEFAIPAAFKITDELSLGISLRGGYLTLDSTQPTALVIPGMMPALARVHQELSGFGIPGVSVGARYAVTPHLDLGLQYRSRLNITADGETELSVLGPDGSAVGPAMKLDTELDFAVPHAFTIGAAYHMLDDKLLVALDLTLRLFQQANRALVFSSVPQGVPNAPAMEQEVELDWRNSVAAHLGFEYLVTPMVPIRIGYQLTNSATPERAAAVLLPPPGLIHVITAGAGLRFDSFDADLAGGFVIAGKDIDEPSVNGPAGHLSAKAFLVAVSGTYRM